MCRLRGEIMNEENEVKVNAKKIRWNIPLAMSCVFEALRKSKLNPKKSQKYLTAFERLKDLYKLTQNQVWLLCITCEHFIENDDSTSVSDAADILLVPAMAIMSWKKDMETLVDRKSFFLLIDLRYLES